ncbi:unnamed protein product [Larinioides sclopetarius]|uniref:BTB domain-containing protein n=1 Tax=Larinioides sclopetarius TaxID=280406 RepID=A0AAV2BY83_9ARAC
MHSMESEHSNCIQISSMNVSLEIKIKDFRTTDKSCTKGKYIEHSDYDFNVWFSASASPNGCDKDTVGWLIVRPYVTVLRGKHRPQNSVVSWTNSVIDIEGNNKFPRSFTHDLSKDITDAKYLERSFIVNRADDFLPGGVLTVRCDICFHCYNDSPALAPENHSKIAESVLSDVPNCDPESKNDPDTGYSTDDFAGFVEKNKILAEVVYLAHLGRVFAVYNPPSPEGRHPKVWIFSTRTESFNVILDDQLNSIGSRFLKASAVFRRCVNAPMKERREKHIELPDFDSKTFKIVVYFLIKGTLPKLEFHDLMEIYKFSHMYEMEVLHRICAEDMVNSLDHERDFEELQKFADFYSDKHLSELLYVCRHGNEMRDSSHFRMDDKPYSDCYV